MNKKYLRSASAILRRIHSRASFQEISDEIIQCAVHSSQSHHGSFVRVDWPTRTLNIVSTAGNIWTRELANMRLEVGKGITGKVAETGKTYCCDNVAKDPFYVPVLRTVMSELAIPVIVEGRVWGIINLDSEHASHYSGNTILQMELLAEMVASAIGFRLQIEREQRLTISLAESEKLSAMGHLVAGIAHEVNNPLASILGNAELFSGCSGNPDFDEAIEVIKKQAKRAGDLVKQLLAFARMGEPEDREAFSFNSVVREAVELVAPQMRLAGIGIHVSYPEEEVHGLLNRTQIQQIIINLLTNAQHAIQQNGCANGRIQVMVDAEDDTAVIYVADNGPGMNRETRAKVFEPFFTTKEKGKGTGLGLSISRDIATAHQGDLRVFSNPGDGCRFVLSLPIARDYEPEVGEADSEKEISQTPEAGGGRKPNILIVDDEAPIRWMLKRLFTPIAGDLLVAGSAEEALQEAMGKEIDVVVSDFHLPGMDGIQLSEKLTTVSPFRFVLITGDSSSPRISNFHARGDVDVIQKPFELNDLLSRTVGVGSSGKCSEEVVLNG